MDLQCSIAGSLEKPQPDDDAVANNNDAAATATTTTTLLDNTHGEVIKSVDEVLECGGGDVVPDVDEDVKPTEDEKSQNANKVFQQKLKYGLISEQTICRIKVFVIEMN